MHIALGQCKVTFCPSQVAFGPILGLTKGLSSTDWPLRSKAYKRTTSRRQKPVTRLRIGKYSLIGPGLITIFTGVTISIVSGRFGEMRPRAAVVYHLMRRKFKQVYLTKSCLLWLMATNYLEGKIVVIRKASEHLCAYTRLDKNILYKTQYFPPTMFLCLPPTTGFQNGVGWSSQNYFLVVQVYNYLGPLQKP